MLNILISTYKVIIYYFNQGIGTGKKKNNTYNDPKSKIVYIYNTYNEIKLRGLGLKLQGK